MRRIGADSGVSNKPKSRTKLPGGSSGKPRNPSQRVEHIRNAATPALMQAMSGVDANRIGVPGMYALGRYAPKAAKTDPDTRFSPGSLLFSLPQRQKTPW